jgi:hypothetical protein
MAAAAVIALMASPALAQAPAASDPNPGAITLTSGIDFPSVYFFRGIRQEIDPAFTMFPYGDVGITLGPRATINFGVWNSLNTGSSGSDGPGPIHYEEDFYVSMSIAAGKAITVTPIFTAYTSPNSMFRTVKELGFKFAHASKYAPYALLAFELGGSDSGQADGGYLLTSGGSQGTYLELGATPSFPLAGGKATLGVPVKLGLSLGDYYESPIDGKDNGFGFFDIGALVTLPLSGISSNFGSWNIHGGVDFLALGDTTKAFNFKDDEGKGSQVIGSIGIGFTY